jgi:flagellar biosynthesis protein
MSSSGDVEDELPTSDRITYRKPSPSGSESDSDKAVSLEYDQDDDGAPVVTAKGEGQLAEKIIELAEENDIPLYEDEDLVELLYTLDLEEEIPPSLYEVVAEIFAFVYRLNEDQKEGDERTG